MTSNDQNRIKELLETINSSWSNRQFENLHECFHQDICMQLPDFSGKISGRDVLVQSYKDFVDKAEVLEFSEDNPQIDIIESTAVAIYTYTIKYRMNDTVYDESAREMFIFSKIDDDWKAVWRTMLPVK